jgi:hypothetical protein
VFWSVTAHARFYCTRDQSCDCKRDAQTDNERARFESAENQRSNSNCDKERHPNLRIAQPRHEQVEGRTRPLLVNGVKKGLLHANKDQPDLSFTR